MTKIEKLSGISRRRRTSKGNVLVETSLIFLVFACMMIGAFDFGQFLFVHQALVERARSAARWGAINLPDVPAPITEADRRAIINKVLYNQAASPGWGTPTYFNLTAANVTVTNPGYNTDDYHLYVHISGYQYTVVSPYIAGRHTGPPITVAVPLGLFN